MKTIFSFLTGILKGKTTKTGVAEEPEPVIPPPTSIISTSFDLEYPPPIDSLSNQPEPVTPPAGKGKKKQGKAKVDKMGFPIIDKNADFEELFQAEKGKKKESKEDFQRLFKNSQLDMYQRLMLLEKTKIAEEMKSKTVMAKIKTYPPPQEELDLHGYSAKTAETKTGFFIQNMCFMKIMTVRVIVGKGLHSADKAVLPDVVEAKIIQLKRQGMVYNYKWEQKNKRKSGALIVYLIPTGSYKS